MLGRGEIFSIAQMAEADAAAIASGIPGSALMENAGAAVAEAIEGAVHAASRPSCCAGRAITAATASLPPGGWRRPAGPCGSLCSAARRALRGDAATAAEAWSGGTLALEPAVLQGAGLVVDALFGAGLARPLDGVARATVEAVAEMALPVIAVDVPSGIDGDTGRVLGAAAPARLTVTFHRPKPGHLLLPGRRVHR